MKEIIVQRNGELTVWPYVASWVRSDNKAGLGENEPDKVLNVPLDQTYTKTFNADHAVNESIINAQENCTTTGLRNPAR